MNFYLTSTLHFLYHTMNHIIPVNVQSPPMTYDNVCGSDRPSGAMQMYVEHTSVIINAGINAM